MAWTDLFRTGRSFGVEPRRRPPEPRPDQAWLHIRSVAADGRRHLLQYAVADDFGAVMLSAFVRVESPVGEPTEAACAAVAGAHALDWRGLEGALSVCEGLRLTAFGAGLARGLLPAPATDRLAGFDCARERFVRLARRERLRLEPGEPAELNDARALVGLPPERNPDAALRALALRDLCRWMDGRSDRAEPRSFLQ
ncbi:hypothetical protein ACO2Q3_02550 [Caulobacter sp. KR2-114]|uniref:hypothetical protein n=1 Tax=Caulobacter sp. KR2-114 TaxID=3400912 RepID=UPI003C1156BF